jgi:hypothetical protein
MFGLLKEGGCGMVDVSRGWRKSLDVFGPAIVTNVQVRENQEF